LPASKECTDENLTCQHEREPSAIKRWHRLAGGHEVQEQRRKSSNVAQQGRAADHEVQQARDHVACTPITIVMARSAMMKAAASASGAACGHCPMNGMPFYYWLAK
jgi:hypothetical protein